MEQIANLSTRKCCLGSNPSLSATQLKLFEISKRFSKSFDVKQKNQVAYLPDARLDGTVRAGRAQLDQRIPISNRNGQVQKSSTKSKRSRSSAGQSICLLSRRSQVRILARSLPLLIMFTVYILYSKSLDRYYTGHTVNIKDRFLRHNKGRSKAYVIQGKQLEGGSC